MKNKCLVLECSNTGGWKGWPFCRMHWNLISNALKAEINHAFGMMVWNPNRPMLKIEYAGKLRDAIVELER
jgi:hypothetical protein